MFMHADMQNKSYTNIQMIYTCQSVCDKLWHAYKLLRSYVCSYIIISCISYVILSYTTLSSSP